jgi:hypothetical protein
MPWPSLSTRSAWSHRAQGISSPRRQGSPSGFERFLLAKEDPV